MPTFVSMRRWASTPAENAGLPADCVPYIPPPLRAPPGREDVCLTHRTCREPAQETEGTATT